LLANKFRLSKYVIIMLIFSLVLQGSLVLDRNTVAAQTQASSVNLSSGVNVFLYDAQIVRDETGKLAVFTIVFDNQSNNTVNLIDYWARMKGTNNKSYVTKLIAEDKDKKYVIPKTTTYMTFYAYVDEKEQLTNLKLDLIKWDFGVGNYERIVGNVKPSSDGTTPYKVAKEINFNKTLVNILLSGYKMYTDNEYAYLSFDVAMRNKSNSGIDLSTLQFYISDDKGTLIELETSPKELALKAQERKTFMLTGTVSKSFVNSNNSIIVMHKDEAVNLPKAKLSLPKLVNTSVNKADVETSYMIDGTKIGLTVKESLLSYPDKKANLETKVILENKSNTRVAMPSFEFYVKTVQGFLYPLVAKEAEQQSNLLPKIPVTLTLQGEVPQDIKLATSQIIVFVKSDEAGKANFLGTYKVLAGKASEPEKTTASRSKTYNDMLIEQVSLQRTPNGMNDLLIAEFKVTNKGKQGKGKLDLTGQFELDGVKLAADSTTIVSLDKLVAVSPGQSYRIIAYTEIPYVQEANKIVFGMSEKTESGLKGIHTFEVSSVSKAQLLASNQNYTIDTLGARGEVAVLDSFIYSGKQSDLFVAKLQYTNKEQRSTIPTQLKGYIENSKQDLVDLEIKKYESKLLPDGKAILYVSAVIPKNYDSKQIDLYFGETLGDNEELSQIVINPVYTSHLIRTTAPKSDFTNLPFMQYDISLYNIEAGYHSSDGWMIDSLKLQMNYDINVRENAAEYTDAEKIIVEFSDTKVPAVVFSKTYEIAGSAEGALQVGKGKTLEFTYSNELLQTRNFTEFDINVYAEYKGYKKLIAKKTVEFGIIN